MDPAIEIWDLDMVMSVDVYRDTDSFNHETSNCKVIYIFSCEHLILLTGWWGATSHGFGRAFKKEEKGKGQKGLLLSPVLN